MDWDTAIALIVLGVMFLILAVLLRK